MKVVDMCGQSIDVHLLVAEFANASVITAFIGTA